MLTIHCIISDETLLLKVPQEYYYNFKNYAILTDMSLFIQIV